MIGFPLRLLAREIYDRIVKIKGEAHVALITGEERIEPPSARYYCCTVESMPIEREFAFVAVDEAQLGADPERGHIFTDRMLHARGFSETMILGSESLRPLISKLLPEAEIITRPRFSTLSYGGIKKLSRLPKRSAIVGFSIEQVYSVAESLRRLRGGCAVVMGALSPRTRNAQVEMFQSGEVDYLVATDAIGMGLNLDVTHVAFAGLSKFDGTRRRRLNVSEMAQIAGRAGRHQKDGGFGTLAGESSEFTPEEILAIEDHRFRSLDFLYWREAEPCFDSIADLIADLELPPTEAGLRAAPKAIDLDVLKRLSEMPEVTELAHRPRLVKRLWEAACLPDFRQVGAEPHARFIAKLWPHLATGFGHLPHQMVANELSRLENVQGDVAILSQRIAAVRTWTYISHRGDWLSDPPSTAQRAKEIEEKLSDALHRALRQRFVNKRTTKLLRHNAKDSGLLPVELGDDNRVFVDGEEIGTLDGFAFRVDAGARAGERKLLLAAAQRHLAVTLRQKARDVKMADDSDFALNADDQRRPAIYFRGDVLGHLEKGRSLIAPLFKPVRAIGELEGDALRDIVTRAESWIAAQMEKHLGGIIALNKLAQDPSTEGNVRALAMQLAEEGGIAGRAFLSDAMAALPKEARGAARKGGIVFGALDVYHHAALKPAAAKWRSALFAARDEKSMPDLPPESAVHLKSFDFASIADCRNAGYRKIGDEYLRIDLAERVIKKAHEARGQETIFGMDMTFVTSLGVSEEGLNALMRDAGFRKAEAPAKAQDAEENEGDGNSGEVANADIAAQPVAPAVEGAPASDGEATAKAKDDSTPPQNAEVKAQAADTPQIILSYWRWAGMRKNKPQHNVADKRPARGKSGAPHKGKSKGARKEAGMPKSEPAPMSSLALQLAALKELQGDKK